MRKLAALALALLLVGCGPSLTAGIVVSTGVLPAHDETYFISVLVGKTTILIPQTRHVPDRCYVTVGGETPDGKEHTEQHEYTCDAAFYATKPGDHWAKS